MCLPDSTIQMGWLAVDSRCPTLNDFFTVFSGSPEEFYAFITDLEKFINENKDQVSTKTDMSIEMIGQNVNLRKSMGTLQLLIYEKDGYAYHIIIPAWLTTLRDKFWAWAIENGVKYN